MPPASCQDKKMEDLFSGNCLSMPPVELIYHFYTDSKCSWYEIPDNAHQWDTVPSRFRDPKLDNLQRNTEVGRLTGSCLCGEVAFAATSPVMMMNCHCSRCRLSRSSAHATNVFVPVEKFQWRKGERCIENYRLPGADRFGTAFCKLCGSLLPRIAGPHDDKINIPAGTLDSDPGMKPRGHIYTDSKAPWFTIEDALPQWPRLP
jgi:hypothetical protein